MAVGLILPYASTLNLHEAQPLIELDDDFVRRDAVGQRLLTEVLNHVAIGVLADEDLDDRRLLLERRRRQLRIELELQGLPLRRRREAPVRIRRRRPLHRGVAGLETDHRLADEMWAF